MIYSVWNTDAEAFDYYEAKGQRYAKSNEVKPKHLRKMNDLGISAARAGWPLPMGARLVGRGKQAKGRIAAQPLSGFRNPTRGEVFLYLALGFVAWQVMR